MNSRNRRQQVLRARPAPQPTAESALAGIADKFRQLEALRQRINELKTLYAQHDALQSELLPLFIQKTDTQFIVNRQVAIGNRTYRLTPFFYDEAKGTILSKRWKSTAHETFTIE